MDIIVVGINHKKAGLNIREKFSFNRQSLEHSYKILHNNSILQEVFILSTCNRVEIYAVSSDARKAEFLLKDFFCSSHQLHPELFAEYFYCKINTQAFAHLFRVASGLDSLILGESQILGQIKNAYEQGRAAGVIGTNLHKLLQDALRVGKKVRHSTAISRGVTSIPGVVVELIKKEPDLASKKALVIGAGKVGSMTVAKLADLPLREVTVVNRDRTLAEALNKAENVRIADIYMLPQEIMCADIVIAATTAPHIVNRAMIEALLNARQTQLLLIDLGVPRNIDETIQGLKGVRLYNIDDLALVIDQTIRNRSIEAQKAEEIIQDEICVELLSVPEKAS